VAQILDGAALAADLRADLRSDVDQLIDANRQPGLATVLMGDDASAETYVEKKQQDCAELGIRGVHVDVDSDASATELYDTIEELNADPEIHGILIQDAVPDHVDWLDAIRRIDPVKDVDGLHPENVGRLVSGDPRYKPCTPHGIQKLLASEDIDPEGKDVVIVNRSNIVGKPLANLLVQKSTEGNATVTVCHSRTTDLVAKTRRADILVSAIGVPGFVDESMVTEETTVIDVGITHEETESGRKAVGDVDFENVEPVVEYITPVPGGVGPMTRVMLLYNTVKATRIQENAPMTSDLQIRRYRPDDRTRVRSIQDSALRDANAYLGEDAPDATFDAVEEEYLTNEGEFLVGTIDEEPVAIGAFRPPTGIVADRLDGIGEGVAELKHMHVDPGYQRQGYGQQMLDELQQRAQNRGYEELALGTTDRQTSAQRFYEANEFREVYRERITAFGETFELLCYRKSL